jgi:hypothetical protein
VKFDVTSSDGSGNGFNYEDGTLAPDEIAARICAAKNGGMPTYPEGDAQTPRLREFAGLCENIAADGVPAHWAVSSKFKDRIWQLSIGDGACDGKALCGETKQNYRRLFQTTTQRWFADPMLSPVRRVGDGKDNDYVDKTLRTVFSHDHFGPSSIQQHGFYTALLIEPQGSQTCETDGAACTEPRIDRSSSMRRRSMSAGRRSSSISITSMRFRTANSRLPSRTSPRSTTQATRSPRTNCSRPSRMSQRTTTRWTTRASPSLRGAWRRCTAK